MSGGWRESGIEVLECMCSKFLLVMSLGRLKGLESLRRLKVLGREYIKVSGGLLVVWGIGGWFIVVGVKNIDDA